MTSGGGSLQCIYNGRVKNESKGIGADISLNVTNSNLEYFKVTEYIQDTQLQAGDETTVTVTVERIKTPINDAASTNITAKLIANAIEDEAATGSSPATKVAGDPESFSTDSWAMIKAASTTTQLEYYQNTSNSKIKQYNGADKWWLRPANSHDSTGFLGIDFDDHLGGYAAYYTRSVSPAFRIA